MQDQKGNIQHMEGTSEAISASNSKLNDTPLENTATPPSHLFSKNPLSIVLPLSKAPLKEARLLAGGRSLKVEYFSKCVEKDPIFILAILRTANSMLYREDRPAITSIRNAIIRLGSGILVETLSNLESRESVVSDESLKCFEELRLRSRKLSKIAHFIAQTSDRTLASDALICGSLTLIPHMLLSATLGFNYTEMAKERTLASLNFKLYQEFEIDPAILRKDYLLRNGFPVELLYGVDNNSATPAGRKIALRFIIDSALEILEAHRHNKWDRYQIFDELPSKSSLRLLALSETQYKRILEFSTQLLDQNWQLDSSNSDTPRQEKQKSLAPDNSSQTDTSSTTPGREEKESDKSIIPDYNKSYPNIKSQISGIYTNNGSSFAGDLLSMCSQANSVDELLKQLLLLLTEQGPFVRAALIVLGDDKQTAYVYQASGKGIQPGEKITVDDPLSPLISGCTKISSCNCSEDSTESPFGVSSFAVSPVKLESQTPVILYADCGTEGSVSFAARRVFRYTIGQVNDAVPQLRNVL